MSIVPYDYQEKAVNSVYEYWKTHNNQGNLILSMPVGSGKSLTIAVLIRSIMDKFGNRGIGKILMITSVKELIEQNYQALLSYWNNAPVGIYSASLKQKNISLPIIYCGIQSVGLKAELFGKVSVIVIDECHMISPKQTTYYRRFIDDLKKVNPKLKVIGFTGTPYRLDCGLLINNGLFDDECFSMCNIDGFKLLMDRGVLCDCVPKSPNFKIDTSKLHLRGGEFINEELDFTVNNDYVTNLALTETLQQAQDREHWLIFCVSVEHAKKVCDWLNQKGISCTSIDGGLDKNERERRINDYKKGVYRACTNVNVLTCGFNFPSIDCLVILRPSSSISLHVQMIGRGIRSAPNKKNCLVLDFAQNVQRLGCINDPIKPKDKTKNSTKGVGEAPVKVCPNCLTYNTTRAKVCCNCGYEFPQQSKLTEHASLHDIIKKHQVSEVQEFNISNVEYVKIKTKTGEQVLVTYYSGTNKIAQDWINLNGTKQVSEIAKIWVDARNKTDKKPTNSQELLVLGKTNKLKKPKKIVIKKINGYNRIIRYIDLE